MIRYSLVYHGNGSTSGRVPVESRKHQPRDVVSAASEGYLSREGHFFVGWNTAADGSGTSYEPGYPITFSNFDIHLYAMWGVASYSIHSLRFDANAPAPELVEADPSLAVLGNVPLGKSHMKSGESMALPTQGTLQRENFTFVGWNSLADGSGVTYKPGSLFTIGSSDVVLYAMWADGSEEQTVTFHGNGSTGGLAPVNEGTFKPGELLLLPDEGTLSRTNFHFLGWNTAADGSGVFFKKGSKFIFNFSDADFYAVWEADKTFSLLFSDNGSTSGAVPEDLLSYHSGDSVVLPGPGNLVKTKFSFAGWNTEANGSGTTYKAGDSITFSDSNVILYAMWSSIPLYSVTFDGNEATDGLPPVDNGKYEFGKTVILPNAGTLVKEEFHFVGWSLRPDGAGSFFLPGFIFTMESIDLTFYAVWASNNAQAPHSLFFNGNGFTEGTVPLDSNLYEMGDTVVLPSEGTMARAGYQFVRWNTRSNGTGISYSPGATLTFLNSNITLYAIWSLIPTYTISFNGNGSTSGAVPTDNTAYRSGQTVTAPGVGSLLRTHYHFTGWNTAANGSGTSYSSGSQITIGSSNLILYAIWVLDDSYTISYNGNNSTGGSVPTNSTHFFSGQTLVVPNEGNLVRTGFLFSEWNTSSDGLGASYLPGDILTIGSSNVVLYAIWEAYYTISFEENGASGEAPIDSSRYLFGQNVTLPGIGTLVLTDFHFVEWNTESDGTGTGYSPSDVMPMPSSNVILYAIWASDGYSLSFDGNGGIGTAPSSSLHAEGSNVSLPENTFTREGYDFIGWKEEQGD